MIRQLLHRLYVRLFGEDQSPTDAGWIEQFPTHGTFGPVDEPTQYIPWWELPVSPTAPTPIADELEAEWRWRKVLNDDALHVPTAWLPVLEGACAR